MTLQIWEQVAGGDVRDQDQRNSVIAGLSTGQGHSLLFAPISVNASGSTALIAALPTSKIKVVGYVIVAAAAVSVSFLSGVTALTGAMPVAANGGVAASSQPSSHLFETAVNTALNLSLSAGVQVSGHLSYIAEA